MNALSEEWYVMYLDRKAEAGRLWDILFSLTGDPRVSADVRAYILRELAK